MVRLPLEQRLSASQCLSISRYFPSEILSLFAGGTMRRRWAGLLASSALVVISPGASAVELPSWTGFYFGGHAGLRWADADLSADPFTFMRAGNRRFNIPGGSDNIGPAGAIFGLHGGYNYQFNNNWLIGLETDISWGKHDESSRLLANDGVTTLLRTGTLELRWQASVRGRVGWIAGPFLFYGTGGVSFSHADWNETWTHVSGMNLALPAPVNVSKALTGWNGGVGVDHLYATGWLIRAEYIYTDYGNFTVPVGFTRPTGARTPGEIGIATHLVRFGASYKFSP
jgi:outer membrane immunogenic protein